MTTATRDDFNKNFLLSLALHGAIIAIAALSGKVLGKYFTSGDVEIIKSAIRVDVVGMPKFTIQELKELEKQAIDIPKEPEAVKGEEKPVETPKEEVEDVVKKDDLVIEEKVEKKIEKKPSFLNTISEYSNKKVAPKEQKKGKTDGASNKNLEALALEGNRLSQGTALTGDVSDGPISEYNGYVGNLPGRVRPNFKIPPFMKDKDLRCKIHIWISAEGKVLKQDLIQSSGDSDFDARAMSAIKSTDFPPPSEAAAPRLAQYGVVLKFPL